MLRRNCNLELGLVTPSFDHYAMEENNYQHQPMEKVISGNLKDQMKQENQKLTIFYNGRVSSCDVTEIQARSIISLASEEIVSKTPSGSSSVSEYNSCPKDQLVFYKQNTGLSLKRSLQQFLHKRKVRIQATSPYNTPR